jgi:hypothetical protein
LAAGLATVFTSLTVFAFASVVFEAGFSILVLFAGDLEIAFASFGEDVTVDLIGSDAGASARSIRDKKPRFLPGISSLSLATFTFRGWAIRF